MRRFTLPLVLACIVPSVVTAAVDVRIDAGHPADGRVSRYLTGACLEDVNHEVYGGLYSQMLFGESFAEPPAATPVGGFVPYGGTWAAADGVLSGEAGNGPRLMAAAVGTVDGEVGVDMLLPGAADGNAGLIVRGSRTGGGADAFDGYEVSLDAAAKTVRLGRHRQNFRLLKEAPCDVGPDRWVSLAVRLSGPTVEVRVDGKVVLSIDDPDPLAGGGVGVRQWHRPARYRGLYTVAGGTRTDLPFGPPTAGVAVSGMWSPVTTGTAVLAAAIDTDRPFVGGQSQRVTFAGGIGTVGVANAGLNRQGLAFAAGKPYDGSVWLRADRPADAAVSLEGRGGGPTYAAERFVVAGDGQWRQYPFALTPSAADPAGRFAIRLASPGSVSVGHAFLQPGDWGRFAGLPVRRDVVEAIRTSGVGLLRYGGSMVNAPAYRWKNTVGPRDRRPPYKGNWYPWSSNGWGVGDFLALCDAASLLGVPDFNADETPADMADFVEYANGSPDSPWGRRRADDGHPKPFGLARLELGNEERVDGHYADRFEAVARAVWARDPKVAIVVGDFQYERPIDDPDHVAGADSKITSLAAHRRILSVAKQLGGEVDFDVHVWTDGDKPSASLRSLPSYVAAIDKLADGAKHAVVVFELNADHADQRRAVDNARAIGRIVRGGNVPIVCSANCLQVDGQNDNGWNQGLVFLNPMSVWRQPSAYVSQLFAANLQPRTVPVETSDGPVEVTATLGDAGGPLVLHVVNGGDAAVDATFHLAGFTPRGPTVAVTELAAAATATNTAAAPAAVAPRQTEWRANWVDGVATYTVPPRSLTVLRVE